ncbi:MAG: hypothetical protein IPN69_13180 [Acidobacteria bacterium]|nr:hypothetical protein [Acidobacteriota bacterium]
MRTPSLTKALSVQVFWGFGLALFFFAGCSNSRSSTNHQTVQTVTPRLSVERLDNGAFINRNGWYVPDTANTRKSTPDAENSRSEQGKPVQVLITTFTPNDSVLYKEEFFANGVTRLYGELVLTRFEECRANDKVYSFLITAKNRETAAQKNINGHNEMLYYRIVDSDGDGTFETLFDENRKVAVPNWASK